MVKHCVLFRQDLIFALDAWPDLIFESAIQPTFAALKRTEVACVRPYHKRAIAQLMTFSEEHYT